MTDTDTAKIETKVELTVLERLVLLNLLPEQGDLTTIRIIARLREELSFTEEEHAALKFRHEDNRTVWNEDAKVVRTFEFGPKTATTIIKALEDLSKQKGLRVEHLTLCDKFGIGEA